MSRQKTLDGERALTLSRSSLEAFPVNRSVVPGSKEAQRMTVTSGRKCSAAFDTSNPAGLLLKTFLESPHWQSSKLLLTWRLKRKANLTRIKKDLSRQQSISGEYCQKSSGTLKKQDILFQGQPMAHQSFLLLLLVPSAPIINGNEYSLLPTPTKSDCEGGVPPNNGKYRVQKDGETWGLKLNQKIRLIPTVRGHEVGEYQYSRGDHDKPVPTLTGIIAGMLPTCTARDYKDTGNMENVPVNALLGRELGKNHGLRLQPAFAEWMMGFSEGWTALNVSEMPSSRRKSIRSSKRSQTGKGDDSNSD